MAGVKGKSGGPRQNAGGARPGAGRKPKAPVEKSANKVSEAMPSAVSVTLEPQPGGGALKRSTAEPVPLAEMDMLQMLQAVALGRVQATATQVRAAVAAVQYTHTKKGDGGKKEEKQAAAGAAAKGRFGAAPPPLRAVK
jgi:phage terminase small subunit